MAQHKAICVDFDNTIHSYVTGFKISEFDAPIDGSIQALEQLAKIYKKVYILTARDVLNPVRKWLKKQFEEAGLEYPTNIECTNTKPQADIYIDDRAYQFTGDWNKTMSDIKTYKVWNDGIRLPTIKESRRIGALFKKI